MEIEIIEKKQEEKKVKFEDLERGTVIKVDEMYGLMIGQDSLLLLNCRSASKGICMACDSLDTAKAENFKVIGIAKKLIVEEI